MSTLSDLDIGRALDLGHITIEPLAQDAIRPASVDLRLGYYFRVFEDYGVTQIDPFEDSTDRWKLVHADPTFVLHPGEFALGTTLETVGIGNEYMGRLEGKSSLGRLGLQVHSTAGYFDPGFAGEATLELHNVLRVPIVLTPCMPIAQMSFGRLHTPCDVPYDAAHGSKYALQEGPTPSQYHRNPRPTTPDFQLSA